MRKLLIIGCLLASFPLFSQINVCQDIIQPTLNSSLFQGVFYNDLKWEKGSVITVTFLNGDPFLQEKVKKYAGMWSQYSSVTFKYVTDKNADIRIAFDDGKGSWSLIGNQSKLFSVDRNSGTTINGTSGPSMNYGWFNKNTEEAEFQRTILHEFGHALSLLHEHLSPLANIKWNKPKVYAHYMQTQGWSKDMVDKNVLNRYSESQTNGKYDPKSIMHYPVSKEFTLDGYEIGWNYNLSEEDKTLIKSLYPGVGVTPPTPTKPDPTKPNPTKPTTPTQPVAAIPYRISNLRYGDGVWSLVMSKKQVDFAQAWRTRKEFPEKEMNELWDKDYNVTNLTFGNGVWALVMSQGTPYTDQECISTEEFPGEEIEKYWADDLMVTDLAFGGDVWAMVASGGTEYTDQTWSTNENFPKDEINTGWKDGYYVTDLEYGNGEWAVIMSKGTGYTDQVWRTRVNFPNTEIQELWQKGYQITDLTFGNGVWVLVMSKGTDMKQQSWRTRIEFPGKDIDELWKK
jgi:Matrixin